MFVGAKIITRYAEVFFYQLVLQLIIETPKVRGRYKKANIRNTAAELRMKRTFAPTRTREGLRTGPSALNAQTAIRSDVL